MNLHKLRILWLTALVGLFQPAILSAETVDEVGTLHEVSAFGVSVHSTAVQSAVYANDRTAFAASHLMKTPKFGEADVLEKTMKVSEMITAPIDTASLRMAADSLSAKTGKVELPKPRFVPDPNRALWLSLVLPGAGQIYNRKYWKLPFIYGGFMGCAYALIWNQQMYRDYSQAYLDIMDDNPATNSFVDMLPPNFDMTGKEEHYKKVFKRKKDFYRRYRDLSAFCFVGVYILSVVDAYVDAQLSVFDISPDLSMSVEPAVIAPTSGLGRKQSTSYGIGCSLRF